MMMRSSPKGFVTAETPAGPMRLRLGFSELADADEYLGRALVGAIHADPMNLHHLRVAFYFGTRELNKGVRSVKQAGRMLEGMALQEISEIIIGALKESGVLPEEEIDEEFEGEAAAHQE